VKGRDDLGAALAGIARGRADAVFVSQGLSHTARRQLQDFTEKNRLPSMFLNTELVTSAPAGGFSDFALTLLHSPA